MRTIRAGEIKIYEDNVGYDYFANLYDENILLSNMPHIKGFQDITQYPIDHLASAMPSIARQKTVFSKFLEGSGRVRMVDANYVHHKLKGTGEVRIKSMGNLNDGECIGIGDTYFWLWLDDNLHVEGDVLAPLADMTLNVVVQENPKPRGHGWKYLCMLAEGSSCDFLDPEILEDGQEWIKVDAIYGEASHGYGSHYHNGDSYVEFRHTLTKYGKEFTVTDEAHNMNLRMRFCDNSGKPLEDVPDRVISVATTKFLADVKWEKELRKLIGRSVGRKMKDSTSGYYRRGGAGVFQLMGYGNVFDYNTEGPNVIDMMEGHFQSVWIDRVFPEDRHIVVATGQSGLRRAQDALLAKRRDQGYVLQGDDYIRRGGTQINKNVMSTEFPTKRPLKYNFAPWGSITFEHWPILDSHYISGNLRHPIHGTPASSDYYIVLDYGVGRGMGSNIELLKKRDSEHYNYLCGQWSPRGPINNIQGPSKFVSLHEGRHYKVVYGCTEGVMIHDLSRLMMFKPSYC